MSQGTTGIWFNSHLLGGTITIHLIEIREGLLNYFSKRNALSKQKREMRRMMRKTRRIKLQHFAVRLQ